MYYGFHKNIKQQSHFSNALKSIITIIQQGDRNNVRFLQKY